MPTAALLLQPSLTLPDVDATLGLQICELLAPQVCALEPMAIALAIKRVWAELFRARCLLYWQRTQTQMQQIHLAILVQPLLPTLAAGSAWVDGRGLTIHGTWGLELAIAWGEVIPDRYHFNPQGGVESQQLGHKPIAYELAMVHSQPPDLPNTPSPQGLHIYQLSEAQQSQYALQSPYLEQLVEMAQALWVGQNHPWRLMWTLVAGQPTPPQLLLMGTYPTTALSPRLGGQDRSVTGSFSPKPPLQTTAPVARGAIAPPTVAGARRCGRSRGGESECYPPESSHALPVVCGNYLSGSPNCPGLVAIATTGRGGGHGTGRYDQPQCNPGKGIGYSCGGGGDRGHPRY